MTIIQAQAIVASNSRLFTSGRQFSQTDLCRIANITAPTYSGGSLAITRAAQRFQCQKTAAYTGINKALRPEGRVIKQKGTNYYVTTLDESTKVVKSYDRRSASITRNSAILSAGIQSHLTFTGVEE
jgi:hypothetical protein